jgi:hypothetical protein
MVVTSGREEVKRDLLVENLFATRLTCIEKI